MKHAEIYALPLFVALIVFLILSLPVLAFADEYPCLCNIITSEELTDDIDTSHEELSDNEVSDSMDTLPSDDKEYVASPDASEDKKNDNISQDAASNEKQPTVDVPSQTLTPAVPNTSTTQCYKMYFESLYVLMKQTVYFIPV